MSGKEFIRLPFLGANDDVCTLVNWQVENDDYVSSGQVVCTVETTKSTIDVSSSRDGYIYLCEVENSELKVNDILAVLSDSKLIERDVDKIINDLKTPAVNEIKVTKKAEILARKNKISSEDLINLAEENKVDEKKVLDFLVNKIDLEYSRGFCELERIAVIGGVSGGGALIVIDSILRGIGQQAAVIFDQDKKYHGKSVLGVLVAGGIELLEGYIKDGKVDSVILAFNKNLQEREKVFQELVDNGVKFSNIIDATTNIRSKVDIGIGNVILGGTYIGACTKIGDNNFISANVYFEHGNVVGSHCGFGPGVYTSGNVTIGNRIRFATGIFIEPDVKVGNNSIISSGAVLRDMVDEDSVVRVLYKQEIKVKNSK